MVICRTSLINCWFISRNSTALYMHNDEHEKLFCMLQLKQSPKLNNNTDDNFESHTARQSSVHHNTERDQNKCSCASGWEQRLVKTGLKPRAQCGALAFATSPAHMRTLHNADIPACCLLQTHVQTLTSYEQQTMFLGGFFCIVSEFLLSSFLVLAAMQQKCRVL